MPSRVIQNDTAGTVIILVRLRANFQITELECKLTDFGNQDSATLYSAVSRTITCANFSANFLIKSILPAQEEIKVILNDSDFEQLFESIEAWRNSAELLRVQVDEYRFGFYKRSDIMYRDSSTTKECSIR